MTKQKNCFCSLTLKHNKKMMLPMPSKASFERALPRFWKNLITLSRMFFDLYFKPTNPCSCATMMITDVADVKPEVTGMEMKSTKKPRQTNLS